MCCHCDWKVKSLSLSVLQVCDSRSLRTDAVIGEFKVNICSCSTVYGTLCVFDIFCFHSWTLAPSTTSTVSGRRTLLGVTVSVSPVSLRPESVLFVFRTLLLEEVAAALRPRRLRRRGQRLPESQPVRLGGWRRATGESDWFRELRVQVSNGNERRCLLINVCVAGGQARVCGGQRGH